MAKAKKKNHIFVATPMYGGQCTGFFMQGVMELQRVMMTTDTDISFSFMFNESLITRARNALAHNFLKMEKATHLMFIDADIKFFANQFPPMIEADKDIICGIYPKKEINWGSVRQAMENKVADDQLKHYTGSFVVNLVDYKGSVTVPINQPVEIWNGGTGFMLIKREVFEKLSKKVPSYTNNVTDLGGSIKEEPIKEFFATSIEKETNILLSEDYHFCKIARKAGMTVWAAPWVQLAHIGSYAFEGQLIPAP
jgi:hypothetical protein